MISVRHKSTVFQQKSAYNAYLRFTIRNERQAFLWKTGRRRRFREGSAPSFFALFCGYKWEILRRIPGAAAEGGAGDGGDTHKPAAGGGPVEPGKDDQRGILVFQYDDKY